MENSENFTESSLKNFIGRGKGPDFDSIHQELERRRAMQTNRPEMRGPAGQKRDPMMNDSAVRSNLAELVQGLLQAGQMEKLHSLLKEHQSFIADIMAMIEKELSKKKG